MSESTTGRCEAAHVEDTSLCEGQVDAVRVIDQHGTEAVGCVLHAARLYASLVRPRVYPRAGCEGVALEVYRRARGMEPFPWRRGEGS